jgi:hypothetical protein
MIIAVGVLASIVLVYVGLDWCLAHVPDNLLDIL